MGRYSGQHRSIEVLDRVAGFGVDRVAWAIGDDGIGADAGVEGRLVVADQPIISGAALQDGMAVAGVELVVAIATVHIALLWRGPAPA